MTNEEYARRLSKVYEDVINLRKDSGYMINQEQMQKLTNLIDFFIITCAKLHEGSVLPVELVPREEHGGVTASFIVFDIWGDDVKKFCDVLCECSAVSIDATSDGEVCIACTIPNVFVPKQK